MSERRDVRVATTVIVLMACGSLLVGGVAATGQPVGAMGPDDVGTSVDAPESMATQVGVFQQNDQFAVSDVTISPAEVEPGETVQVDALVTNDGDDSAPVEVSVEIDGEPVETRTVEGVPAGFSIVATFEISREESGTYSVSVNGVEADRELVVTDGTDDSTEASDGSGDTADDDDGSSVDDDDDESHADDGSHAEDGDGEATVDEDQFSVVSVTLEESSIEPGEAAMVRAEIANHGEEPADFEVTLEVDGEPVKGPEVVPEVFPETEVGAQHVFEYEPEEPGEYTISVNGVEANSTLEVGDQSGGAGPFGILGILPMWLIRPLVLFVALPLLVVYLALKALAIYLGY